MEYKLSGMFTKSALINKHPRWRVTVQLIWGMNFHTLANVDGYFLGIMQCVFIYAIINIML